MSRLWVLSHEIGLKTWAGGQEHLREYLAMVALELRYTPPLTTMVYNRAKKVTISGSGPDTRQQPARTSSHSSANLPWEEGLLFVTRQQTKAPFPKQSPSSQEHLREYLAMVALELRYTATPNLSEEDAMLGVPHRREESKRVAALVVALGENDYPDIALPARLAIFTMLTGLALEVRLRAYSVFVSLSPATHPFTNRATKGTYGQT